jgi:hypothetical protein
VTTTEQPKVFVAIPTGSIKEYAFLYMLASIRNIYYPPEKLEVHFGFTDRGDAKSCEALAHLKGLIANAEIPFTVHIHTTNPAPEEVDRWGPYSAVIVNCHILRCVFLDGDADYFWILGGDNPPGSGTLRRLLALEADCCAALIHQRPNRGREFDVDGDKDARSIRPIFWEYVWRPEHVRSRKDLEPQLKHSLLRSWVEMPPMRLAKIQDTKEVIKDCTFGSGCELVKRRVLEDCGYYLGLGYHSEDIAFGQWVGYYGYSTALDPKIICAHFDPDGRLY